MNLLLPEDELLQEAIGGNRLALERLLLMHATRLARHVEPRIPAILAGVVDVDDILQQTFLQIYQNIGGYQPRGPGSFFAWMREVADNRLFDCIREFKRKKRGGDYKRQPVAGPRTSVENVFDLLSGRKASPSQSVARAEAIHAIQAGIVALPDDQREAVQRHCIYGESLEEVSQGMGKTIGAVRALVYRGKTRLQELLDRSAIWMPPE